MFADGEDNELEFLLMLLLMLILMLVSATVFDVSVLYATVAKNT